MTADSSLIDDATLEAVRQHMAALSADSPARQALAMLLDGHDRLRDQAATQADALAKAEEQIAIQNELLESMLADRTGELRATEDKLQNLIGLGIAMAQERDEAKLMQAIIDGAKVLANADGGTLYLVDGDTLRFEIVTTDSLGLWVGGTSGQPVALPPVRLFDAETGAPNHRNVVSHAVHERRAVNIGDAYSEAGFDFTGTRMFDQRNHYRTQSVLTVPLLPRGGDVIGALQLLNARDPNSGVVVAFPPDIITLIEALGAQAAIALDNQNLLQAQRDLMDAFIQLIAGAIDAKSPYTGGHCNRVPELAMMLARAASEAEDGPFAAFALTSDEEWREFRTAAWLHDCGKVTTPEFVVDKATKLETIYNRIHEVRMRFEVLWRDAEIAYWKARARGGADEAQLLFDLEAARRQISEDFAFVAECNIGGEFMSDDKVARLRAIANRSWVRHLDSRLGLSHEELRAYEGQPVPELPAREPLLADRPEHIVPHTEDMQAVAARHGFTMAVPEHLYNRGELYNLSIGRGTLTAEERFKINDHIVQTIRMLEALPWTKGMRRVPEIAGAHHETMIGTGYPRGLTREQMSVPARIMAIADIFEALTASDRPYKKAKTLSEAIKIMSFMKKDQHIDPDLFRLFLEAGVYKRYADAFLHPSQIDEVNPDQYLG